MASITNPRLAIATDRAHDEATVTVVCDVQFTDFEVNAMNQLGLRYALRCRVFNKNPWYETTSLMLEDVELPRVPGAAIGLEEVAFEAVAPLDALREHMVTRDELFAELTLVNNETDAEQLALRNADGRPRGLTSGASSLRLRHEKRHGALHPMLSGAHLRWTPGPPPIPPARAEL